MLEKEHGDGSRVFFPIRKENSGNRPSVLSNHQQRR
jgi:hypothetical protein